MSKARSTLFPNGVSNADPLSFAGLANLRFNDPTKIHALFDDFDYYHAADWAITGTNAGTPALIDTNGGNLSMANVGALAGDGTFIQKVGESFLYDPSKELWYVARVQVSEAIESAMVVGMAITDASPLDPSHGLFFRKDDGAATVDFVAVKAGTETVISSIATMEDGADIELAFHYDAVGKLTVYANNILVATAIVDDNYPDDNTLLTPTFGVQNGEAAAKNGIIDFFLAAFSR